MSSTNATAVIPSAVEVTRVESVRILQAKPTEVAGSKVFWIVTDKPVETLSVELRTELERQVKDALEGLGKPDWTPTYVFPHEGMPELV